MHLGSLESTQKSRVARGATLTHLSYSPNFSRASITRYTHAKREQILNFSIKANRCVFELRVPCVKLFHCVNATEFDYGITTGS